MRFRSLEMSGPERQAMSTSELIRRVFAASLLFFATLAVARASEANDAKARLLMSSNWTYQLQGADLEELGRTRYDVLVVDAFLASNRSEIERLRTLSSAPAKKRIVLAYLSVGAAEVYRYYWQRCCSRGKRPEWIGAPDQRWPGNYHVRFWRPEWKSILFEEEASYLHKIVELGFDGVFLDRVADAARRPETDVDPKAEMARLVRELSKKAKSLAPNFLVVAQNAEELVADAGYLAAIDGIVKEDLLFGAEGNGQRNNPTAITSSIEHLKQAQAAGKHVLIAEYLDEDALIDGARTEILELGFVPYFAPRKLDRLRTESLEQDDSH